MTRRRVRVGDRVLCQAWNPVARKFTGPAFEGRVVELEGEMYLVRPKGKQVLTPLRRMEIKVHLGKKTNE